jgi:hypothetical protein
MGIKNYYFNGYVNNYLKRTDVYIELTDLDLQGKNTVCQNIKYIDINEHLTNIFSWKSSEGVFERGGEYPYFTFKITASECEPLFLSMIVNDGKNALKMTFYDKRNQIAYIKHIDSGVILEDLLSKLDEAKQ